MQGYINQAILNLGEWLVYNCIANYTSNNNKLPGPVMLMTYHINTHLIKLCFSLQ